MPLAAATAMPVKGGGVSVAFGGGGAVVATSVPLWVEPRIVPAAAAAVAGVAGAEPEPEPEPETGQTWIYRSLGAGVVRSGVSKTSDEVGKLAEGEEICVVEIAAQPDGVVRQVHKIIGHFSIEESSFSGEILHYLCISNRNLPAYARARVRARARSSPSHHDA